jgi:hypothetical protein
VALTDRDSSRTLYVNGVRDNGGSNNLVVDLYFPNTRTTCLGNGYNGNGFTGVLDEVRFYDRALSAGNIAYLYADTTVFATAVKDITRQLSFNATRNRPAGTAYTLDMVRAHPALFRLYSVSGRPMVINSLIPCGVYLLQVKATGRVQKVILLR